MNSFTITKVDPVSGTSVSFVLHGVPTLHRVERERAILDHRLGQLTGPRHQHAHRPKTRVEELDD